MWNHNVRKQMGNCSLILSCIALLLFLLPMIMVYFDKSDSVFVDIVYGLGFITALSGITLGTFSFGRTFGKIGVFLGLPIVVLIALYAVWPGAGLRDDRPEKTTEVIEDMEPQDERRIHPNR